MESREATTAGEMETSGDVRHLVDLAIDIGRIAQIRGMSSNGNLVEVLTAQYESGEISSIAATLSNLALHRAKKTAEAEDCNNTGSQEETASQHTLFFEAYLRSQYHHTNGNSAESLEVSLEEKLRRIREFITADASEDRASQLTEEEVALIGEQLVSIVGTRIDRFEKRAKPNVVNSARIMCRFFNGTSDEVLAKQQERIVPPTKLRLRRKNFKRMFNTAFPDIEELLQIATSLERGGEVEIEKSMKFDALFGKKYKIEEITELSSETKNTILEQLASLVVVNKKRFPRSSQRALLNHMRRIELFISGASIETIAKIEGITSPIVRRGLFSFVHMLNNLYPNIVDLIDACNEAHCILTSPPKEVVESSKKTRLTEKTRSLSNGTALEGGLDLLNPLKLYIFPTENEIKRQEEIERAELSFYFLVQSYGEWATRKLTPDQALLITNNLREIVIDNIQRFKSAVARQSIPRHLQRFEMHIDGMTDKEIANELEQVMYVVKAARIGFGRQLKETFSLQELTDLAEKYSDPEKTQESQENSTPILDALAQSPVMQKQKSLDDAPEWIQALVDKKSTASKIVVLDQAEEVVPRLRDVAVEDLLSKKNLDDSPYLRRTVLRLYRFASEITIEEWEALEPTESSGIDDEKRLIIVQQVKEKIEAKLRQWSIPEKTITAESEVITKES